MGKQAIHSDNAPAAIGTYSQAIRSGDFVFLSGQIPLDPATMEFVDGDFEARTRQVFENLKAVAQAAGGDLDQVVKLTIFLTDLANFAAVNSIMEENFIRSANPPTISAGVMIANVSWNMANTLSGMSPTMESSVIPAIKMLDRPPINILPSLNASE